jgi:hypothetical protein
MSRCAYCGQPTVGAGPICVGHDMPDRDDWATANRMMCDFVHRGVVSPMPRRSEPCPIEVLLERRTPEPAARLP